jgi:hypothetical protein
MQGDEVPFLAIHHIFVLCSLLGATKNSFFTLFLHSIPGTYFTIISLSSHSLSASLKQ